MIDTDKTTNIIFENNFSKWESWLVSFYRNKGLDSNDIDDLVQTVLLKVHTSINKVEPSKHDAWIASVARNALTDLFRSKGKHKAVSTDTLGTEDNLCYQLPIPNKNTNATPEDYMNEQEETDKIKEALTELNGIQFEIVNLFYFQDMSQEEIAIQLGIPIGTVKSRLFAALQKLKKKIS